eukprot:scaffold223478_cov18-Tisochrysis_lutea.AAC.1
MGTALAKGASVSSLLLFGTITSLISKTGMDDVVGASVAVKKSFGACCNVPAVTIVHRSIRAREHRRGRAEKVLPQTMGDDEPDVHG